MLLRAWTRTYPLFLGYVSVAFVFGVITVTAGHPGAFAVACSAGIFAGASQFLLVGLLRTGAPLAEIAVAVLLLNSRHVFYYRPIEDRLPRGGWRKWYSILAITDENFAVLSDAEASGAEAALVIGLSHLYWIAGTALGVMASGAFSGIRGLDFSLTALFAVLALEKADFRRDRIPLGGATAICAATWFLVPSGIFLMIAMGLSLGLTAFVAKARARAETETHA